MKKQFILAATFIISSLCPKAQTDTIGIDEVVVTATRYPVKQSQTGKVITVIDKEILTRNAGRSLTEIINENSSIHINGANQNFGSNQEYYLRGAATSNTLILIDGVPVQDPSQISNYFDFNSLNPQQLEKIEILRGAQSTLWGSNAVAGVINIITKKANQKGIQPQASVSYGSYNTFKGNAGITGKKNNFTFNLQYGYTNSTGFSSAYDTIKQNRFDKDFFKQHNINTGIGYRFSNSFLAEWKSRISIYKAGVDVGAFTDDADAEINNKNQLHSLSFHYNKGKADVHFVNAFTDDNRIFNNDSLHVGGFAKWEDALYKGRSIVNDLYGTFSIGASLKLVAGLQRQQQNMSQDYKSISSYGPFSTLLGDTAKTHQYAAYTSLQYLTNKGFSAEAGIRYNNHSIYGDNTTFSLNPSFAFTENSRLFVNISSAFKVPSLYQLYSEYGNKDLQPEKSVNYEAGIQSFFNNKQSNIRATFFKRNIKDVIVFVTNADTWVSNYQNKEKQFDHGFEIESRSVFGKMGSIQNIISYVTGKGEVDNKKIDNYFRRPNFTFKTTLSLNPAKNWDIVPSFRYAGKRLKGEYDTGPAKMPDHYILNLYTAYKIQKNFRIYAEVNNITDQFYFDVPGYTTRGRNFSVGIAFR